MDRWLRNVNVVRILALALAILLWAVVHLDESPPTQQSASPTIKTVTINDVSIDKINLDESQFSIKSITPAEVSVRLRGRNTDKVSTINSKIQLDLSTVTKGVQTMKLQPVGFPSDLSVEILPANEVTVVAEEKVKKEMPVTIDLIGHPSNGYKAGTPIIKPNRVHVTVPSSRLEEVASVRADFDISGAEAAVERQVRLVAYNAGGHEIAGAITPSVVDVVVPITSPFKTMPLQIKMTGHLPDGYSIASYTQSINQVTVYGPQDILDELDFYDGLQIELDGLKADKIYSIDIPLKDKLNRIEPKTVNINLKIVPSAARTFENMNIGISGKNDEYDTKVIDPESGKINLTLKGAAQVLEKIRPEEIQVFVDASNLPQGKHDLPLVLNLPPYVEQVGDEDLIATVEIKPKTQAGSANNTPGQQEQSPEGE